MSQPAASHPYFILVLGVVVILAMLVKGLFERLRQPPLVGYVLLGLGLRLAQQWWDLLGPEAVWSLEVLADVGLIALLFRVGLESKLHGLLGQLPRALPVWMGDVLVSAFAGFAISFWLLHLGLLPSLFVATALSATSVGVTTTIWGGAGALRSRLGEILLDVAELDDISAVILMVLLFSAVPLLQAGSGVEHVRGAMLEAGGWILLKGLVFGGACVLFSRFVERRYVAFFVRLERPPAPVLAVLGGGLVIAAFAAWLNYSVAVGAVFAGILFSRDPEAIKLEASFLPIYEFFVPFFFLGVGYRLEPGALVSALGLGMVLLLAAVAGKFVGAGLPVAFQSGLAGGTLIGASMMPRAEIALFVMHQGSVMGEDLVPPAVYGGMVFVSAITCIAMPLLLPPLLARWPQPEDVSADLGQEPPAQPA